MTDLENNRDNVRITNGFNQANIELSLAESVYFLNPRSHLFSRPFQDFSRRFSETCFHCKRHYISGNEIFSVSMEVQFRLGWISF